MSDYVYIAKKSEIPIGRAKAFTINGKRIAVFNDAGNFYALDNACAHALGALSRGRIKDGLAICPVHSYAYDARTGICQTDGRLKVNSYNVIIEEDRIQVKC